MNITYKILYNYNYMGYNNKNIIKYDNNNNSIDMKKEIIQKFSFV